MYRHHHLRRTGLALAAPLASLALLITPALAGAGVAEAKAASCSSWTTGSPPSPGSFDNLLRAVTALSACNVWAVGHADGRSLILNWNGRKWARVPSPSPGSFADLNGVVALSASSGWAVGDTEPSGSQGQTFILRWNGKKWTHVASPSPGHDGNLEAVTAVSAGNAWAVGDYSSGTSDKTLVLHWNGRKWARSASPNPSGTVTNIQLHGVSATSGDNAWTVGTYTLNGGVQKTITMRWNGRAWKIVANPSPGQEPSLAGVSAVSARNAWAVGSYLAGSNNQTLIMHWDGRAWDQIVSPAPGNASLLNGVAAASASNVWAVGAYFNNGTTPPQNLAIHCC